MTLTSQPLAALPSQSSKPAPQAPGWQVPSTQVGGALGKEQTMPQPLQLSGSVRVCTSQPLTASPSQSAYQRSQLSMTQTPATHTGVALDSEHTLPQEPQLFTSVWVSMSSSVSPSQSLSRESQVSTPLLVTMQGYSHPSRGSTLMSQ